MTDKLQWINKTVRVGILVVIIVLLLGFACSEASAETRKLTDDFYIIEETCGEIAPGITDKRIVINTAEGNRQNILYVCEVDVGMETVGILAGYPDYDPTRVKIDTTTNQAADVEKATGKNVVVAVNNNFFSEGTGAVEDLLIMNGEKYSGGYNYKYFGVTSDGVASVGIYDEDTPQLKEAVSGRFMLIARGEPVLKRGDGRLKEEIYTTRNAVGMKADGTVVYLVMEGKCSVKSTGVDVYDVTEIMCALGCTDAILPDGGGSSTYAVQRPGTDELMVENAPSYGVERKVSATLMFTSSAEVEPDSSLTKCEKSGHTYTKTKNTIKCTVCGISEKAGDFSGLVTDTTSGKKMFYINGKFQTGWTPVDRDMYYFNSKGFAEKVTIKSRKELRCTENGYIIYRCNNAAAGNKKEFKVAAALGAPGHSYDENKVCERCGWKEIVLENCSVKTQQASYNYTGKPIEPEVIITAKGRKFNGYYDYKVTGYENNTDYGTGKVYVTTNVRNGGDLIFNTSSLARQEAPYAITFKIKPAPVTQLKGRTIGTGSVRLSWKGTLDATGYRISKYNTSTGKFELKKIINDPDVKSWTFKNLAAGKAHRYRVTAIVEDADGSVWMSNYKAVQIPTNPMKVRNVKVSNVNKTAMKVKWNKTECTGYQIRYSTNKNFKFYKQVNLVGKAKTTKQFTKLKSGKKYYVKVRAYTTVNNTKVFGAWSNVKSMRKK